MDREEKICIVRNDLTQIGVPPIFDELLEEGGGSYIAGDNITIEDNVISAIVPDISNLATKEEVNAKQDTLTEGDNITIENNVISAIVPDISNLATKEEVNAKQDTLTAGDNITIEDNVISAIVSSGDGSVEVVEDGFYITDENMNIVFKISNGVCTGAGLVNYK